MLQFRNISTYMLLFCHIMLPQRVFIYRKVSVSSNDHMMHPLTIGGNRHLGAQHRFTMADSFKRISGGSGCNPQKL